MSDAKELLLKTAFRHRISEPNVEMGFERFRELTTGALDYGAFRDALEACVRENLIRDPVRLVDGGLQCHWTLELTTAGQAVARASCQSPSPTCGRGSG